MHHPSPDIYFALYVDVFECLFAEFVFAQCLAAASNWAAGWASTEDSVHAGLAHLVVAFRVDQEAHVRVEVSRGLADRADLWHNLMLALYIRDNFLQLTVFISTGDRIGSHGELSGVGESSSESVEADKEITRTDHVSGAPFRDFFLPLTILS